ncbi:hypothetical protein AVEN_45753-1 [Araneus ventricosus]|uniref:Uncharacterized protein n=1 Tax=Araneus ventricosus TaxID=182803 RepID=A0A4Y2LJF0_ARAVE|nr:hypothetical protein AVEN_45753-1 [Araneus ventricosus]
MLVVLCQIKLKFLRQVYGQKLRLQPTEPNGRINAASGSCKSTQLGLLSGDLIMGAGLPAVAGYRLRAVSCLCRKGLHSGQLSDDGVNSGGRYPLQFGIQWTRFTYFYALPK